MQTLQVFMTIRVCLWNKCLISILTIPLFAFAFSIQNVYQTWYARTRSAFWSLNVKIVKIWLSFWHSRRSRQRKCWKHERKLKRKESFSPIKAILQFEIFKISLQLSKVAPKKVILIKNQLKRFLKIKKLAKKVVNLEITFEAFFKTEI